MVPSDSFSPHRENWKKLKKPFTLAVCDNFLPEEYAHALSNEFLSYNDPSWHHYSNPVEEKKACRDMKLFPSATQQFFREMLKKRMAKNIGHFMNMRNLEPDPTLHGSGWHSHKAGGKLNLHLDYSIHPNGKQRKVNFILYLTPGWRKDWGGELEFWKGTEEKPEVQLGAVAPFFNRAVIFDTSAFAWHGVTKVTCPEYMRRNSIALYYMSEPDSTAVPTRRRAKYYPTPEQAKDKEVLDFIEERSK
jgi:Rps23 Pro-64 3,4-dihydroxylase Tpa1-like proline 4-hydroxylase